MVAVCCGIGIFCGCVGKSAQVPLFCLVARCNGGPDACFSTCALRNNGGCGCLSRWAFLSCAYPDVLLVIAYTGGLTLFIAATIAVTATDIKRVLAYSTVSQLGYMMLALGVGGWVAGLFHLITHAFFKSLLFLCSGSVIHACHTNDMRKMGWAFESHAVHRMDYAHRMPCNHLVQESRLSWVLVVTIRKTQYSPKPYSFLEQIHNIRFSTLLLQAVHLLLHFICSACGYDICWCTAG